MHSQGYLCRDECRYQVYHASMLLCSTLPLPGDSSCYITIRSLSSCPESEAFQVLLFRSACKTEVICLLQSLYPLAYFTEANGNLNQTGMDVETGPCANGSEKIHIDYNLMHRRRYKEGYIKYIVSTSQMSPAYCLRVIFILRA